MRAFLAILLVPVLLVPGCSDRVQAGYDPTAIEAKYGLKGGYLDKISTENGMIDATIVPTTLADGRQVQLVIPHQSVDDEHQIFMRDGVTITPIEIADPSVKRQDFVESSSNRVIERRPVSAPPSTAARPSATEKKRSVKDEILIVGGSAGAGAAIGALAGGKKGAAVGAASGGVAGLIYDLATREK